MGGAVRLPHLHGGLAPQAPPAGLRLRRQGGEVRQQPGGGNRQAVRPLQRLLRRMKISCSDLLSPAGGAALFSFLSAHVVPAFVHKQSCKIFFYVK